MSASPESWRLASTMFQHLLATPEIRSFTTIMVEPGLLDLVGAILRERFADAPFMVISDATVAALHGDRLTRSLLGAGLHIIPLTIPAGESSKSHSVALQAYDALAAAGLKRDAVLIALGGGVVSDLTGFVAATWMRGVRWVVCPTTMEAMVDAAIGGKTGVNLPAGKNLIGAFHLPELVLIDPTTLDTLPRRDVCAGLAESVKHAVLFDPSFLSWHEARRADILALDRAAVAELIAHNVRLKANIVAEDPWERTGRRVLLNFGHTIGHALESVAGYRLRHGECVAIGMAAAARLSSKVTGLPAGDVARLLCLVRDLELPTRWSESPPASTGTGPAPDPASILTRIQADKKHATAVGNEEGDNKGRRWVLLEAFGRATVYTDVRAELVESVVAEALA